MNPISPIKPLKHINHRHEYRDSPKHPERDGHPTATVDWRDETGKACKNDIGRSQVRIEQCTPDGGGKDEQDNAQNFTPGNFVCQYQAQNEKQGKPS